MKLSELLESAIKFLEKIDSVRHKAERNFQKKAREVKKTVFIFFLSYVLLVTGLLLVFAGVITYLSGFFPIEIILVVSGLIMIYVVLLLNGSKKQR
ncbi:MAG: hypothetical protein ACLFUO_04200 [Candidatus Woesearchaeota archaeon]